MSETIPPMLAEAVPEIPEGDYFYEPKWDGFRALVFHVGTIRIQSRDQKDLTRYFPELVTALEAQLPDGAILDGEIVLPWKDHLDFGLLQQRIHPAQSRIEKLSRETPASYIAFDLLSLDRPLMKEPFKARREALESLSFAPPIYRSASSRSFTKAQEWFARAEGQGVDGIVAKEADMSYQPDVRAMKKIKHFHSADCVVAGYRTHKADSHSIGALLLGLYDNKGLLHYVGSTSSFSASTRREIFELLQPFETEQHQWLEPAAHQRVPGALSRWSGKKDLSFTPIKPAIVCEVRYDQLEGERFRHTTTFLRWRPDREASSCTFDQLLGQQVIDLRELIFH